MRHEHNTEDIDLIDTPHMTFEWPHYYFDNDIFIPVIRDLHNHHNTDVFFSHEFNTVAIHLNGRLSSDLDWSEPIQQARKALNHDKKILWRLDIGLFEHLNFTLDNQAQFYGLLLAVNYFVNSVWPEFERFSLGICLWQSTVRLHSLRCFADATQESCAVPALKQRQELDNDKEVLLLECALEYVHDLIKGFPLSLKTFVALDLTCIENSLTSCRLVCLPQWDGIQMIIKGASERFGAISWSSTLSPWGNFSKRPMNDISWQDPLVGLVLGNNNAAIEDVGNLDLKQCIQLLKAKSISFRVIPENHLLSQWDNLDFLICHSAEISSECRRILHGFCAAGGSIVTLNASFDCSEEISFNSWYSQY